MWYVASWDVFLQMKRGVWLENGQGLKQFQACRRFNYIFNETLQLSDLPIKTSTPFLRIKNSVNNSNFSRVIDKGRSMPLQDCA